MKSKISTLLFIFVAFIGVGQVPNTTTFSLQDVVNVVEPDVYTLQSCFNDAVSAYFDPAYSGSKNSLLNFRNYGACPSYISSGSLAYLSNTNSLTVPYPAVNASDIVFIAAGHYSSSTMSLTGWSSMTISYSSFRYTLFYKLFSSSDAGGNVYITSTDYATKFASAHRVRARSSSTVNNQLSALLVPSDSHTPSGSFSGDNCEMALTFAALFISQSLGISPASGWTVRNNVWQSSYGANSLTTYNFDATTTISNGTYTFTGPVTFGYITVTIE